MRMNNSELKIVDNPHSSKSGIKSQRGYKNFIRNKLEKINSKKNLGAKEKNNDQLKKSTE